MKDLLMINKKSEMFFNGILSPMGHIAEIEILWK